MVKFWLLRIKGDITRIDEVPELWREAVRKLIEAKQTQEANK